jgi:glycosyltransferase involved in cell wall biosynthesis
MAAGLPVVVTPVGGVEEVVADGQEGFFAPVGDAGMVAARLGKVLDDPELRGRLGSAARNRAQDFDLTRTVRRLEAIYDEVLAP